MNFQRTILIFLLLLPTVFAQADKEATTGVLRGLLGDLPNACSDVTSSVCIYCLGYVKLLPLAFFFGLFYLILVIGVKSFTKGHPPANVPSIQVGVILISIALSFFIVQIDVGSALSRIATFRDWVGSLIVMSMVTVIAFFVFRILNAFGATPDVGGNPIWMVVLFVLTLVMFGVLIGFAASFAGSQDIVPFFVVFGATLFFTFAFYFLRGTFTGNIVGVILLILYLILFAIIRGDIGAGFLPELFKPSEDFSLGICQ